ncbi:hypothetical protein GTO10_05540 [Candidatus Saccharibacteria bacterium]|nr:hypothetical protein [Candidatus Saccharibacteria bacterium]
MVLDFLFGRKEKKVVRTTVGVLKPYDRDYIKGEWTRVEELVSTARPSAFKEAVILADKLLDYALAQISSGETMGERLKNAAPAFSRDIYQGLWDAHKARNALVHEAQFDLTTALAKDVLAKFKKGFMELGVRI